MVLVRGTVHVRFNLIFRVRIDFRDRVRVIFRFN